MTRKLRNRSASSLAGWLFADLSIVLMILFASTGLKAEDLRCENQPTSSNNEVCSRPNSSTTTTIEPGAGGVRPKPIVVVINNVRARSEASFQSQLELEIANQATSNPELRTASDWDYGVILIFGGSKGGSLKDGDRIAKIAQRKIKPGDTTGWRKIRRDTFFKSLHETSLPLGSVKIELFPIITK